MVSGYGVVIPDKWRQKLFIKRYFVTRPRSFGEEYGVPGAGRVARRDAKGKARRKGDEHEGPIVGAALWRKGMSSKLKFHVFSLCLCELSTWKDLFDEWRIEALTGLVQSWRDILRVWLTESRWYLRLISIVRELGEHGFLSDAIVAILSSYVSEWTRDARSPANIKC